MAGWFVVAILVAFCLGALVGAAVFVRQRRREIRQGFFEEEGKVYRITPTELRDASPTPDPSPQGGGEGAR